MSRTKRKEIILIEYEIILESERITRVLKIPKAMNRSLIKKKIHVFNLLLLICKKLNKRN